MFVGVIRTNGIITTTFENRAAYERYISSHRNTFVTDGTYTEGTYIEAVADFEVA